MSHMAPVLSSAKIVALPSAIETIQDNMPTNRYFLFIVGSLVFWPRLGCRVFADGIGDSTVTMFPCGSC